MATPISAQEHTERRERLVEHCRAQGLGGFVLFDEMYIKYFAGFGFLATERPVAFACNASGESMNTILVTDDGIEILTDYPRDLESLTIPA